MHRRLCDSDRFLSVLDLGATPACEKFLTADELDLPEPTFPLHLRLCEDCLLLQIPALITPQSSDSSVACLTCTIVWPMFSRPLSEARRCRVLVTGTQRAARCRTLGPVGSRSRCFRRRNAGCRAPANCDRRDRSIGQTIRIAAEDRGRATWGRR